MGDKQGIKKTYDLIIIGGGIYGATLLWEASHRGLSTLLLEKNDFGSGTSANSLKTIHGGIRYLQQLNVPRVIISDREKKTLNKIAPNLITPLQCCLVGSGSITQNFFTYWLASKMFNLLSAIASVGHDHPANNFLAASAHRSFNFFKNQHTPANSKNTSVLLWQDAQVTNSERLNLAYIRSALACGGSAKNYTPVVDVVSTGSGYEIGCTNDQDDALSYQSTYVIDCTGANQFSENHDILKHQLDSVDYVAAVNLVLDKSLSDIAFALPSFNKILKKKGMVFFSPWKGVTLAGTWYFHRSQVSNKADLTAEHINGCVTDICLALKSAGVTFTKATVKNMIADIHLGFLPAKPNQTSPEAALFEKTHIHHDNKGYYCLQGNKYTTARYNACKLIDQIAQNDASIKPSESHFRPLQGAGMPIDLPSQTDPAWKLLSQRYGDLTAPLQQLFDGNASNLELVPGSSDLYQIEIDFLCKEEQVSRLSDLLYRRINHNVHKPINAQSIKWCADRLAHLHNWPQAEYDSNLAEVTQIEADKTDLYL